MTPELILQRLEQLEALLRQHQLWQADAPSASALSSQQPFCLDTLQPHEWLQWIFLPRMQQLIVAQQPLPRNVAIAPYFEMAMPPTHPAQADLVQHLTRLDALFTVEPA